MTTITIASPAAPTAPARRKSATQAPGLYSHLVLIPLAVVCLFPLYWMVVTALRPEGDVFSTALWPQAPTLENFAYVLKAVPLGSMLLTTTYMAAITTLLQATTGLMAAYVFARSQARAGKWMLALLTVTWLIPPQVIMIPNFVLVNRMGLLDTLGGLVLPHAASAFAIMLLYQAIRSFPKEVIESAEMDGCGHVRILFSIIVPNLRPVIASISILLFITSWNEYLWPLLVTRSAERTVVQIGLQMFMTEQGNQWAPLMAAATLASLPILAIYLALQRQIIDTFVRSGLR
ncbi:MAG TPA: carbohydrate ABC transporter permease [Ramlibacter sp.]|nr:carbohydrate ABC transporter permease [Ramlibacter sp.]